MDLLVRTSGELRVSNFLIWATAYAELYFTDRLWPEFDVPDFFEAIAAYQMRDPALRACRMPRDGRDDRRCGRPSSRAARMPEPPDSTDKPKEEPKRGLPNVVVRFLTAAVGIPILLWMLYLAPTWVFALVGVRRRGIGASELAGMTLKGQRGLQTWMVLTTARSRVW